MNSSCVEIIEDALAPHAGSGTIISSDVAALAPRPELSKGTSRRKFPVIIGGVGLGLGLLMALLVALRWLVPPVSAQLSPPRFHGYAAVSGQERIMEAIVGVRTLAADMAWLHTHLRWEARDVAGTEGGLRWVTAIDPRPLAFWLNGARMLAYDMPEWRTARIGRGFEWRGARRHIEAEQVRLALGWLDRARSFHPHASEIFVERALIELYRVHDLAAAAASFSQAAEQPGAPDYAARLHAGLLRRLGREGEARAWLAHLRPAAGSAAHDGSTDADWVLANVRYLESEL